MRLPVLMYHDITVDEKTDYLTVSLSQLETHLAYISKKRYHTISLKELSAHILSNERLPDKSILITFDDGYQSNVDVLQPLIKKYHQRAVIFLTANFIDKPGEHSSKQYLSASSINQADPGVLEFGCHSFDHKNYNALSIDEIRIDIRQMFARFAQLDINVKPFFAYTYGAAPKNHPEKMEQLINVFDELGVIAAFRIGNRINQLPLKNRFLIERIDIRGTDSSWKFPWYLRMGRKMML